MNLILSLFVLIIASLISAAYNSIYFYSYGLETSLAMAIFYCCIGGVMDLAKIVANILFPDLFKNREYMAGIGMLFISLSLMGVSIFTMSENFNESKSTAYLNNPIVTELKKDITFLKLNIRELTATETDQRKTLNRKNADDTLKSIDAKKAELKEKELKLESLLPPPNQAQIISPSGYVISVIMELLIFLFGVSFSFYKSQDSTASNTTKKISNSSNTIAQEMQSQQSTEPQRVAKKEVYSVAKKQKKKGTDNDIKTLLERGLTYDEIKAIYKTSNSRISAISKSIAPINSTLSLVKI